MVAQVRNNEGFYKYPLRGKEKKEKDKKTL